MLREGFWAVPEVGKGLHSDAVIPQRVDTKPDLGSVTPFRIFPLFGEQEIRIPMMFLPTPRSVQGGGWEMKPHVVMRGPRDSRGVPGAFPTSGDWQLPRGRFHGDIKIQAGSGAADRLEELSLASAGGAVPRFPRIKSGELH